MSTRLFRLAISFPNTGQEMEQKTKQKQKKKTETEKKLENSVILTCKVNASKGVATFTHESLLIPKKGKKIN